MKAINIHNLNFFFFFIISISFYVHLSTQTTFQTILKLYIQNIYKYENVRKKFIYNISCVLNA